MSKQLYEEAIADLKKVKEIAEDNAKRAIIEAVAPRIKELIEKELLGESDVPDTETDPETGEKKPVITGEKKPVDKKPEDEESEESGKKNESTSFTDLTISGEVSTIADLNERLLYVENTLMKLTILGESTANKEIVNKLEESVDSIYDYLQNNVEDPNARLGYGLRLRKCLEKLENFQETKMKRNLLGEEKVTIELELPGVDLDPMSDEGNEPTVELVLPEEGEEESEESGEETPEAPEGEEASGDIFGSEGEEEEAPEDEEGDLLEMVDEDTVVEIDESMLRREIAFMKLLREADESDDSDVQAWGHGAGKVSSEEDFESEDLGDALDLELSESVADDEGALATDGGAADNLNEYGDDQMLEVDEDLLEMEPHDDEDLDEVDHSDELLELDMDESKPSTPAGQLNAQPGSSQHRDPMKESVRSKMADELKLQESLRKRAVELKKVYEASKKTATAAKTLVERKEATTKVAQLKAAYAETAEHYNSSVTRFNKLSNSLTEGTKSTRSNNVAKSGASADVDTLSKKLAETNLFNAKLLFTNKLLQTESLTARQKAQVIEQLDAAETIREAKLVYESLAKALVKPRKTVTEGRILGSSSQATRPASTQTLSEGVETERWAKLAGIVK